jgi:hypothetical protein
MRQHFSSECPARAGECEPYAHQHCAGCNATLYAVGGGGDDGRGIGGYEQFDGRSAEPCASCGSDSLLCQTCKDKSPLCPACDRVADLLCSEGTCVDCLRGAA